MFLKKQKNFIELNHNTKIPITNKYKTPETLGYDRLASVIGAAKLYPKKNILVIDIGTCIKFNFINSKKEFLGGSISPGLSMRFKALHEFTAKLPLLDLDFVNDFVGNTTEQSIKSGVLYGIIGELRDMIKMYQKRFSNLVVVVTGGDELKFLFLLKLNIFAEPNLIATGLNEILKHNVKKG